MGSETTTVEKRDSIEVSKTATGKYSYKVKLYYDKEMELFADVVSQIHAIHEELQNRFEPKDVK